MGRNFGCVLWIHSGWRADEGLFCRVSGIPRRRSSGSGTTTVLRPVPSRTGKWGPSSRVLLPNSFLWYGSAIALEEARSQYVGVWARFVLFTSSLLFCRFSTLLTRYVRRKPVA